MISDEEYFNRKATVLEYDRQIMRGNVKPMSATTDPEQLYKEARQTVGNISFAEMTKKYPDLFEIHDKKETLLDLGMAAFIGFTSGMISEIFVGAAGENKSWSQLSDQHAEKKMVSYAEKKAREQGKTIPHYTVNGEYIGEAKSATKFLEGLYKVPYDQATSAAVGNAVDGMRMSNHHFYSASHSPGLGGLFSAVSDQFFNTSTFFQPGTGDTIVTLGTGNGLLAGRSVVGKIIAGFGNWYGHNMSDLRGGSGAVGRGSGLPVPMMQYMGKCSGKLGASDFSTLLCKVYEQGYDYRYGKALSAPIVINDMLTRIVWAAKHYSKTGNLKDSIPMCFPAKGKEHYDLSNMLLMSNAAFLAFDTGHAALKSHGDPITFLCNCNFKEWFNFAMAFSRDYLLTAKRAHDVKRANASYLEETAELYASMNWS